MNFQEAYQEMKDGEKVALPDWGGYWRWDNDVQSIIMHCKDGRVLDIRETDDVDFTINFTFSDKWQLMHAPAANTLEEEEPFWWEELDFRPEETPILKLGDEGDRVKALQNELNRYGADLKPDGDFGGKTQTAVRNMQIAHGLVTDGIFGEKTALAMRGQAVPGLLSQKDLVEAANRIGCKVEAIMAVSGIESRGRGFWSNGFPVILFERHWMCRLLRRIGVDVLPLIKREANIVNTKAGGYKGGIAEYGRLNKAKRIDLECALQSASWGAYQIMGFHWQDLGYKSPVDFVDHMRQGEAQHLDAFVRFILNNEKMAQALRDLDFYTFAINYNGPAAVELNDYPNRMNNEFNRLVDHRMAA